MAVRTGSSLRGPMRRSRDSEPPSHILRALKVRVNPYNPGGLGVGGLGAYGLRCLL